MKRVARTGAAVTTLALGSALTLGSTLTFGLMLGMTGAVAAPTGPSATIAQSDADVVVANENGTNEALIGGGTVFDLNGSEFQSVVGGQGGIYVAFGWVDQPEAGKWAPSAGGENGVTYKFAPDDEQADNGGYLKFVTFPGGATSVAANGGVLEEDGTWATELAVPTPQFESKDREGNGTTVDCLEVQCGIVTIGAHNIKNANNETFTPVNFVIEYTAESSDGGEADGVMEADAAASEESETADAGVDTDATDTDATDTDAADTDAADTDGSETADADAVDADATDGKTEEVAPNRAIQFGIIGAVLVVGVTVLRSILRRRSNG